MSSRYHWTLICTPKQLKRLEAMRVDFKEVNEMGELLALFKSRKARDQAQEMVKDVR